MRKLSTPASDVISGAQIITDERSALEIRHLPPSTFILIEKERRQVLYCFESANMARLLSEYQGTISSASQSNRSIISGEDSKSFHELLLELSNGEKFIVSESGRIHKIAAYHSKFPAAALAYTPQSLWQMPAWAIPKRMILTGRLIDTINEYSGEGGQTEIVNLLDAAHDKSDSGLNKTEFSIMVDRHQLNCLVVAFERIRLFDLNP